MSLTFLISGTSENVVLTKLGGCIDSGEVESPGGGLGGLGDTEGDTSMSDTSSTTSVGRKLKLNYSTSSPPPPTSSFSSSSSAKKPPKSPESPVSRLRCNHNQHFFSFWHHFLLVVTNLSISQLSNLWWMHNLARKGFGRAIRAGRSKRFQRAFVSHASWFPSLWR